jgi:hypothetical protein
VKEGIRPGLKVKGSSAGRSGISSASRRKEKGGREQPIWTPTQKRGSPVKANPLIFLEAATGLEPVNNGFAVGKRALTLVYGFISSLMFIAFGEYDVVS